MATLTHDGFAAVADAAPGHEAEVRTLLSAGSPRGRSGGNSLTRLEALRQLTPVPELER